MENVHGPFGIEGTFNAISVLFTKPPPRFAASQEVLRRRIVVKREKQPNKAASQQEGWYEKAGEIWSSLLEFGTPRCALSHQLLLHGLAPGHQ